MLFLWHEKLGIWIYPGGHTEENETPQQTAIRETLEETGIRVKVISPEKQRSKPLRDKDAYELPRPLMILYENVHYKTGKHEHFDMLYLATPEKRGRKPEIHEATRSRWIAEPEIDGLDTYENIKWAAHMAFLATTS